MKMTITERDVENLKERLQSVRKASLSAHQRGDFRSVARLTCEAAELNKAIQDAESMLLLAA